MSDNAQTIRQLTIKTGTVRRYFKEEQIYRSEAVAQEKVVAQLKNDRADGADIRAAERVLKDSEMMVPRTRKDLETAYQALQDLVDALRSENEIAKTQQFRDAFSQLQQVETAWQSEGN